MKLTICNGTPKQTESNTDVLLNEFMRGYSEVSSNKYEKYQLNKFENLNEMVALITNAEYFIIGFPLYNYSMPSIVKDLIERMVPLSGKMAGKKIGFIVQYGFPEAIHARALERYLEKLTVTLGAEYLGMILKGNCNNLTNTELKMNRGTLRGIYKLGKVFGETGRFDKLLIKKFVGLEKLNFFSKMVVRVVLQFINHCYWEEELKLNGAYKRSFSRPYGP